MTIAPDETIEAADLDALIATALVALKADNAQVPLGHHLSFRFTGTVAATPAAYSKAHFVVPFDCFVECVRVFTHDVVGVLTVTLTGNGNARAFPISITDTMASGSDSTRGPLYDSQGALVDFATDSPAVRTWNKGSTIDLAITTANVDAASVIDVVVALRSIFGRD